MVGRLVPRRVGRVLSATHPPIFGDQVLPSVGGQLAQSANGDRVVAEPVTVTSCEHLSANAGLLRTCRIWSRSAGSRAVGCVPATGAGAGPTMPGCRARYTVDRATPSRWQARTVVVISSSSDRASRRISEWSSALNPRSRSPSPRARTFFPGSRQWPHSSRVRWSTSRSRPATARSPAHRPRKIQATAPENPTGPHARPLDATYQ